MDLGLTLTFNTGRKSYMTFKNVTFNLTLSDLERSNSRSQIFEQLIFHFWTELGLRFQLTIHVYEGTGN